MLRQGAALIHTIPPLEACFMSKTSLKNVQKQKKKAKRAIPRPAQSRIQGNTAGVRTRLKKLAGQARGRKASA